MHIGWRELFLDSPKPLKPSFLDAAEATIEMASQLLLGVCKVY
jgi:hypothetical protein